MREGSQRWNKSKALTQKNLQKKIELYKNQTDFQGKKSLQKRKLEAWSKATSSGAKKAELQEEEEEEIDEEDLSLAQSQWQPRPQRGLKERRPERRLAAST
jgi:sulfur relay (sulfurtransferase) DsrF/TusC family protein